MKNKKILFVIDNLKIGGAEQVFLDIVKLCKNKLNFNVLLITDFEGEQFILPDDIVVIKLRRKSKYNIIDIIKVRSILSDYQYVHIHMRHTFQYLRIIKLIFGLKNKFIFHDHYGKIGVDKSRPFKFFSILKPDIYIGVCQELCEWASNIWKIEQSKIYLFINLPSREFLTINVNDVRGDLELVMVGNIKEVKNQNFALKISKIVNKSITFVGKNQDDHYFKKLKSNLGNNKIISNCNDVKQILTQYKIGLFTSKSESGPLVLLEYLLCGLPFISYKTGGISEILYKYFPDFFIDSFDERIWVERLNDFYYNPPKVGREIVMQLVSNEFNENNYLKRLMHIYES